MYKTFNTICISKWKIHKNQVGKYIKYSIKNRILSIYKYRNNNKRYSKQIKNNRKRKRNRNNFNK